MHAISCHLRGSGVAGALKRTLFRQHLTLQVEKKVEREQPLMINSRGMREHWLRDLLSAPKTRLQSRGTHCSRHESTQAKHARTHSPICRWIVNFQFRFGKSSVAIKQLKKTQDAINRALIEHKRKSMAACLGLKRLIIRNLRGRETGRPARLKNS